MNSTALWSISTNTSWIKSKEGLATKFSTPFPTSKSGGTRQYSPTIKNFSKPKASRTKKNSTAIASFLLTVLSFHIQRFPSSTSTLSESLELWKRWQSSNWRSWTRCTKLGTSLIHPVSTGRAGSMRVKMKGGYILLKLIMNISMRSPTKSPVKFPQKRKIKELCWLSFKTWQILKNTETQNSLSIWSRSAPNLMRRSQRRKRREKFSRRPNMELLHLWLQPMEEGQTSRCKIP